MRQTTVIILAFFFLIGCKEKPVTLNQKLIEKILNLDTLSHKYWILNYYQGRFDQNIENDTATLTFNGFYIAHIQDLNDSILFESINRNDTIAFFNYQSSIRKENLITHELDSSYAIRLDSIKGIDNSSDMNLYSFDWTDFPSDLLGFMTFSEPIVNKNGDGFIARMIYTRDYFQWEVYQFDLSENIVKINCQEFKVPGYKMIVKTGKIKYINPYILVFQGHC